MQDTTSSDSVVTEAISEEDVISVTTGDSQVEEGKEVNNVVTEAVGEENATTTEVIDKEIVSTTQKSVEEIVTTEAQEAKGEDSETKVVAEDNKVDVATDKEVTE